MNADEYARMVADARRSITQQERYLAMLYTTPVAPHATILCWHVIMESGQAVFCGQPLDHYRTPEGHTLTMCPHCDRYDPRSDQ